ncbi:hypothetical protein GCM10009592_29160 [Brachybacterium rhamnosum]|uniref:Fis family transcriptional regulator n=1 Tax=Brachybacterium rhamnosum TaxID=173361 RepID=A0ABW4Q249_9MICO
MRFERIFEDIEGRHAHEQREEMRALAEDLTRAERSQLLLADRMRAAIGARLVLHLRGGRRIGGRLTEATDGWVLLTEGGARRLVPLPAVGMVEGLGARARPRAEGAAPEQSLTSVLRALARDRGVVRVTTIAGEVTGRISTVGADALDLRTVPTGEAGAASGPGSITVALGGLLLVSSS